jgi:8-oxo-dGTP diphosphatase
MVGNHMKILYGTTNKAKLQAMRNAVELLGIDIIGLDDIEGEIPKVKECGKTPLENAEIKAKAYYEAFKMPVFSCDSGLYFDELEDEEQPGIYVRRVNGRELSDDEMIEYYSSLARRYGGKITGQYWNAIYFVLDENHSYSSMDKSIATEPFILSAVPHPKRVEGFPLDSLSIDISEGEYYYNLDLKDVSSSVDDGVIAFFKEVLSQICAENTVDGHV